MNDKELRKLNRSQLLEMLLAQSREIDRLRRELAAAQKELDSREIKLAQCGSIAEASLALTNIFAEAQRAADQYLENVRRVAAEQTAPTGPEQVPEKKDEAPDRKAPAEKSETPEEDWDTFLEGIRRLCGD